MSTTFDLILVVHRVIRKVYTDVFNNRTFFKKKIRCSFYTSFIVPQICSAYLLYLKCNFDGEAEINEW